MNPHLDAGPFHIKNFNEFNKYLPYPCIENIIKYLNATDCLNLIISKLFAPYLLQSQKFFDDMNTLWCHIICQHILSGENLYLSVSFTPVILNNRINVLIDSLQASTMHYLSAKNPHLLNSLQPFINYWEGVFKSFYQYKIHKHSYPQCHFFLSEMPVKCDKYCTCIHFKYYTDLQNKLCKL